MLLILQRYTAAYLNPLSHLLLVSDVTALTVCWTSHSANKTRPHMKWVWSYRSKFSSSHRSQRGFSVRLRAQTRRLLCVHGLKQRNELFLCDWTENSLLVLAGGLKVDWDSAQEASACRYRSVSSVRFHPNGVVAFLSYQAVNCIHLWWDEVGTSFPIRLPLL